MDISSSVEYTPAINLGHAVGGESMYNKNSYIIFPEPILPGELITTKNRKWFASFAESMTYNKTGSEAAELSVEAIYQYLVKSKPQKNQMRKSLESSLYHANKTLLNVSQSHSQQQKYQAAALSVCIAENRLYFTYCGDVHAYLLRGNLIYHLTHAVALNRKRNAMDHRMLMREVTPAIGSTFRCLGEKVRPKINHISFNIAAQRSDEKDAVRPQVMEYLLLNEGDVIVICSNSVSVLLNSLMIEEAAKLLEPQEAAEEIVIMASAIKSDPSHAAVVLKAN